MKSQQQLAPVRRTDPETSREAAESMDDRLTKAQNAVLSLLTTFAGMAPMSDEHIADWYRSYIAIHPQAPRQSASGLRTRRAELVAQGKIVHGGFGINSTGRRVRLWRAV